MPMSARENYLRAVEMREPEWIPCTVSWPQATWQKYRERLEDIVVRHPSILGDYERGSVDFDELGVRREGGTYEDEWGCVWHFVQDGLQGQVKVFPLEDWSNLDSYEPPDPLALGGPPEEGQPPLADWNTIRNGIEEGRERGALSIGHSPHGFLFQRLYYLRGFRNLMVDFVTEPPELTTLIDMVVDYNMKLINKWLEIGVDVMVFGDDLGTQDRLTIHPKAFRKYLAPAYTKTFGAVRATGTHVYLHSDGHWLEVADDLIMAGTTILNPQSRARNVSENIDNIGKTCKGKVCIDLDLDRQVVLPMGSPQDIENHVREAILKLGSKQGGLMLKADLYPDVPLTNIEALCQTLEKYRCAHTLS